MNLTFVIKYKEEENSRSLSSTILNCSYNERYGSGYTRVSMSNLDRTKNLKALYDETLTPEYIQIKLDNEIIRTFNGEYIEDLLYTYSIGTNGLNIEITETIDFSLKPEGE